MEKGDQYLPGRYYNISQGDIGLSFPLACDLTGRPYSYCPGHTSMVNIETSSYVVLSQWDQGNIDFYDMPENWKGSI